MFFKKMHHTQSYLNNVVYNCNWRLYYLYMLICKSTATHNVYTFIYNIHTQLIQYLGSQNLIIPRKRMVVLALLYSRFSVLKLNYDHYKYITDLIFTS